jgi:hypothetical protein
MIPTFSRPEAPSGGATDRGLYASHQAVGGGYWHQRAFAAYVAFNPDGSVSGSYYQYGLEGSWTPRDSRTLTFTAALIDPEPGMKLQWQPMMTATVTGDTLELAWPDDARRDYLVRRATR